MSDNTFGRRVRDFRKARGWTQNDLASIANLSQGEVCKIEKAHVNVSIETVSKLASALEIHVEDLVHGTALAILFGQPPLSAVTEIEQGPSIIAYFASALTGLVGEPKKEIEDLDERIDHIFRRYSAYPIALYRPRKRTSPTDNPDIPARDVYEIDQQRVASAHLVILAALYPSLGAGMELQLALQSGTTVILLSKKDQAVSRMVLGCPAAIEKVEYADLNDLEEQLIKLMDQIMPSLAKFQFLHSDSENTEEFELGERIRRLRVERHLQPIDLARMVGVGASYIETLESKSERITNPSLYLLRRIARALLTSETYLVSGHISLDPKFQTHYDSLQTYANEIQMPVPHFNVLWSEHYEEFKYDLSIPGVANRADIGNRKYWVDRYERFKRSKPNGNLFAAPNS